MGSGLAWWLLVVSASAWKAVAPPATDAQWQCANASAQEWRVQAGTRGELLFAHAPGGIAALSFRMPDGGRLVGTDRGEFGGSVDWVSDAGDQRLQLLETNPVAFTLYRGDVYIASGLSHLGVEYGTIHRLHRQGPGRWQIDKVLDLGEAPGAALAKNETWTLATGTGVVNVDLRTLALTRVHTNRQWGQVHPTSLQQREGRWFVGARSAVIRLTPTGDGWREEWLLPPDCAARQACRCS
jgi:hypothetical protein